MENEKGNILKDVLIIGVSLLVFSGCVYMFFVGNIFKVNYDIRYTAGFFLMFFATTILVCIVIFIVIMARGVFDELNERSTLKYAKRIQSLTTRYNAWSLKNHSVRYLKRLYKELKSTKVNP